MQIAFGRVRRKTAPARKYVRDCYSLKCPHIFGLYYNACFYTDAAPLGTLSLINTCFYTNAAS